MTFSKFNVDNLSSFKFVCFFFLNQGSFLAFI